MRRRAGALTLGAPDTEALGACGEGGAGAGPHRPAPRVGTLATGQVAPWALTSAPDGRVLVTERPGRLRARPTDGVLVPEPIAEIEGVATPRGEGGLLGLARASDFARGRRLYRYHSCRDGGAFRAPPRSQVLTPEGRLGLAELDP